MAVARSTRLPDDTGHPYPNHPATSPLSEQSAPLGRSRSSSMPAHMYHSKASFDYNGAYHYSDQFTSTQSSQPRGIMAPPHLPLNASLDSVLLAPPSVPTVSPSSLSRTFVRSKSGMLVVTDFAPTEGEENVPITVGVLLDANALPEGMTLERGNSEVKLRLVFGRTAVKTDVKRMLPSAEADAISGIEGRHSLHLKLNAFIPPYADSRFPEQRGVPMSVQVMGGQENVIESFTFGMFTYWGPATMDPSGTVDNFAYTVPPMVTTSFHLKRKSEDADLSDIVRPSPPAPAYVFTHAIKPSIVPAVASTLVRLSAAPAEERDGNSEAQEAELEWVINERYPDPNSLDKKWTTAENEVGRRLIRFQRDQLGNKLFVSCEVIPEEAYNEEDIVISCIRRPETRNCWFTSVDVIYLLERLVGNPFTTEEKNRIRRNLEGLKPTTVSKHKPGFDAFFQRIMDFPPPKPRNIEKDVKVFPWSVLGNALDKIVQKYSVIPCPPLTTSPRDSLSGSSSSHEMSASSPYHNGLDGHYSFPPNSDVNVHNHEDSEYLHQLINPDIVHPQPDQFIPDFESMPTSNTHDDLCALQPSPPDFSEDWRRRASIASSMSAASDMYQDTRSMESGRAPFHAFSNPFAENISLGGQTLTVHAVAPTMDGSYSFGHPASASARMSSFPDIHALHLSDGDVRPHVRRSMDADFIYPPPVHLGL